MEDKATEEHSVSAESVDAVPPGQNGNSEESRKPDVSGSEAHGSPGKSKQKTSPSKHHHNTNKLTIDLNASLAAISAKLQPVLSPGESEIVRINREALATVSKRYQQQAARIKTHDQQSAELDENDEDATNPPSQSPIQKVGIPPALHESIIAEEWVNVHLETNGVFLLPATDIQPLLQKTKAALGGNSDDTLTEEETFAFRKHGDSGPLGRAGIDRASLYRLGMPKDLVDRLYRALYVYTNGFHNIINEIAAHCPPLVEKHVSSNVWLTFLLLLEQCENGKYEMAMLKFKHATQEWRRQMQEEFFNEKTRLEAQLHVVKSNLNDEAVRSAEKSNLIANLTADAVVLSDQQQEIAVQAEQIRLLKLEILVHEDDERKLNEQLDDTRKDYEIANAERINALAERYALEEEIRKMQVELERVEAEKSNYAKRMHEGLFMNQALRATNETLKQNAVVLAMEKDKQLNEKVALHGQLDRLQQEIRDLKLQKAQVEKELLDSQRKHQHLDVRIQTMKEQFEIEVVSNTKHVQEIAYLKGEIDEERVKVGVLEAKCNLLTAEKQNTGMRAQDKLRIERLLNQKLELENLVEAMKLDRTKDQEQIWNLRASLEALDTEMQHSKRVFSAGQQAFLHSERTCEQLRNQLQDVEKKHEKTTKNLSSLKERFKLFDESSKDQITKLEVELKVTSSQLREVSYANRDNTALIAELNKSLETSAKETKSVRNKLEASEQQYTELKKEKEDLQRDQTQRELQRSTSKNAIHLFIRSLQHILALVKLDEYPFDEALRELLRMIHETFGVELDIDKVLEDEDEDEEFVEELDEEDEADEQRMWRKLRHSDSLADDVTGSGGDQLGSRAPASDDEENGESGRSIRTQITRMSKFRKSKLDKLVKKLQRDSENKSELIQSLEGVVCEQAGQVAQLTRANEQQERWLKLNENQKGMLHADIDARATVLFEVCNAKETAELKMRQAETDRDIEVERVSQLQLALGNIRRQFDMQSAENEDLQSKIWRDYEHHLLMLSLRRDKGVQATVTTAEHSSQTLVPQRNPATERARIASMYIPAANPTASTFGDIIQQINQTAKVLLPEVASDISSSAHFPRGKHACTGGLDSAVPVVHPTQRGGRNRRETEAQYRKRYERTCGKQPHAQEHQKGLPAVERGGRYPPRILRHVNEFGTRQDVLISPVYPPYFNEQSGDSGLGRPSMSTTRLAAAETLSKIPRKPSEQQHRRQRQVGDQGDERCSSPRQSNYRDPPSRSPRGANRKIRKRFEHDAAVDTNADDAGDTGLRYHRGFLRTGMEILRGSAGQQQYPEDISEEDDWYGSEDGDSESNYALGDSNNRHRQGGPQESSLSPRSPGRLEVALRGYQKEQGEQQEAQESARRRRLIQYGKDDQVRTSSLFRGAGSDDVDDGFDIDADVVNELDRSPFVPAALYPLLPPQ